MNETKPFALRATDDRPETERNRVTAEVISCPGQLCDDAYSALQINIEGFESPYVLTLTLRAVGYKALSEQGALRARRPVRGLPGNRGGSE